MFRLIDVYPDLSEAERRRLTVFKLAHQRAGPRWREVLDPAGRVAFARWLIAAGRLTDHPASPATATSPGSPW